MLAEAVRGHDLQEILEQATHRIRDLTGHDRVKAYRFLPDGAGEVVAEARALHAESFLGLRFPATDIPQKARELYASTPVRVIADVNAADSPLLAADGDDEPLDLSLAITRGTSPIHLRYMQNMGVRSTLTLPIIVNGKMWGLFAAHHLEPMLPDPATLATAELVGQMLSLIVQHAIQHHQQRHLQEGIRVATKLVAVDDSELSNPEYWTRSRKVLTESIPCHGLVYCVDRHQELSGDCPDAPARDAIRALATKAGGSVCFFNDLRTQLPDVDMGDTAGALVLTLRERPNVALMFLRNVAERHVTWAGEPLKDVHRGAEGFELHPRSSFAQYTQSMTDRCDDWTSDDLETARTLQFVLAEAVGTQEKLKESRHRLGLLVRELNHRVRNILTLVHSLARQSRVGATSIEMYAEALEQRIFALSGAHNLLTDGQMRGTSLDRIAALELRPYQDASGKAAIVEGPPLDIRADVVPVIALVVHELTSNAAKYGALSTPAGRVSLTWWVEGSDLRVRWQERGGPTVQRPMREGFGRSIIESAIPFEFDGDATLTFAPSGVVADFRLPGELFTSAETTRGNGTQELHESQLIESNHKSNRALVVEDNYIISQELSKILKSIGFMDIDAAPNIAKAQKLLAENVYEICLLDVDLGGNLSRPVATELIQRQIPFVFVTGYGSEGKSLCDEFSVPSLTKPVNESDLTKVIEQEISQ